MSKRLAFFLIAICLLPIGAKAIDEETIRIEGLKILKGAGPGNQVREVDGKAYSAVPSYDSLSYVSGWALGWDDRPDAPFDQIRSIAAALGPNQWAVCFGTVDSTDYRADTRQKKQRFQRNLQAARADQAAAAGGERFLASDLPSVFATDSGSAYRGVFVAFFTYELCEISSDAHGQGAKDTLFVVDTTGRVPIKCQGRWFWIGPYAGVQYLSVGGEEFTAPIIGGFFEVGRTSLFAGIGRSFDFTQYDKQIATAGLKIRVSKTVYVWGAWCSARSLDDLDYWTVAADGGLFGLGLDFGGKHLRVDLNGALGPFNVRERTPSWVVQNTELGGSLSATIRVRL